jgi:general nucleoside transport system ATP-binding protein
MDADLSAGRRETAASERAAPAIELRGISKAFGPVQANRDISIRVEKGTIHGIIGENGAGKSTLMSILYGFYRADAGEIVIGGKVTQIPDSQAAIRAGIGMVFQHFKLVENFTVLENVVLGAEDGALLRPSLAKARRLLTDLAREYELNVDPDALIENLSVGHQQRVEILKALYRHADILILDEPTGVLTPAEADHLFRILKGLKDEGKTIVLITHKLREIMSVTDTVSVMRRGEMVATVKTAETSPEQLAELMVGRKVLLRVDKRPATPGKTGAGGQRPARRRRQGGGAAEGDRPDCARGRDPGHRGRRRKRAVGTAGGAGRDHPGHRHARINDQPLDMTMRTSDGQTRRDSGIAHVPEDRQRLGLIMDFTAWENVAFGYHNAPGYQRNGMLMDPDRIRKDAEGKMRVSTCGPRTAGWRPRTFPAGTSRSWCWRERSSATPTCCWSASRPAAWTSARSSSSTSRSCACATPARRSCWSAWSWTRS